jgi:hypothetical protein
MTRIAQGGSSRGKLLSIYPIANACAGVFSKRFDRRFQEVPQSTKTLANDLKIETLDPLDQPLGITFRPSRDSL